MMVKEVGSHRNIPTLQQMRGRSSRCSSSSKTKAMVLQAAKVIRANLAKTRELVCPILFTRWRKLKRVEVRMTMEKR
jgi:hypothetical protein